MMRAGSLARTVRAALWLVPIAALLLYFAWFYVLPEPVNGFRIARSQVTLDIAGPGLLDARNKVTVTTRVAGFLKSIAVDQNDSVDVDQVIAQVDTNNTQIRSQTKGVVVNRNRNVGDFLAPGAPLMEIIDPSTIVVVARFDESVIGIINPGQRATVRFASEPEQNFAGSVLNLGRQVDEETREFRVELTLEKLPVHWAIGQRANVVIEAPSSASTIAIARTAVVRDGGHVGVWISRNDRADWVPLTLGYPAGPLVEVVNGLQEGDVVRPPEGRYRYEPITTKAHAK
jgi:multidrug efflux pump subunit AcrA (membrane-fusion protein)